MQEIKIHPAAECVRLMDADELASLAASIEANGLRDPIIMGRVNGAETQLLVDGRNRLLACEMAKVEPRFQVMPFEDDEAVKAFVADKSEHRNVSKGQHAMRIAWLWPEPKRGMHSQSRFGTGKGGPSKQRLSDARSVLAFSRELALEVRDGNKKLDLALAEVKTARDAMSSEKEMLSRLRQEAADLADLVEEDRMKPREAIAALDTRIEDAERKRISATQLLASLVNTWHPRTADPADYAARITENVDPKHWPKTVACELSKKELQAVAQVVTALAEMADKWEDR
jgi:ParB-like nuclease domain